MTIKMTAKELVDKGLWNRYCELTDTNEWAISEGLISESEVLEVPEELVFT